MNAAHVHTTSLPGTACVTSNIAPDHIYLTGLYIHRDTLMSRKPQILCMEDYPDTRLMLTMLFKQAGYDVLPANTLEEARELLEANAVDLYLLDHVIGGDSGLDLCKEIRAVDSSTPICFYTGMAGASFKEAALEAGANAYVTKPSEVENLMSVISNLLSEKN